MKTRLQLTVLMAGLCFINFPLQSFSQTIYVPQSAPYTNDAYTVLLQHFDGTTSGTTNGAVSYTNGVFAHGVHVTSSSFVSWNLGALSQGTVELWARVDTMTNEGGSFISAGLQPNNWGTFEIAFNETNYVYSVYNDINDNWDGMTTDSIITNSNSIIITTNTWHHYATTWGSQGFHFYVDGKLVYSNSVTLGQNGGTTYWSISANRALGNIGVGFNGTIDELRISNIQRVFAPQPTLSIYTAVEIDFLAASGQTYQIQGSGNLTNWINVGSSITGSNQTVQQFFSTRGTNSQYYRLQDVTP